MKNRLLIFVLLFSTFLNVFSQRKVTEQQYTEYTEIPQEKVFLHFNSNFLLTGERLDYKAYCLNYNTNKFSNLSKIAYIELIDSNLKTIIKQKITLKKGEGQGDFFINTDLKSGNYKLIAYTQWMKNKNLFYQENIYIINPFSNKVLVSNTDTQASVIKKNQTQNQYFVLEKNEYSKREKITIKLTKNAFLPKNASVSVRKIDEYSSKKKAAHNFFTKNNKLFNKTVKNEVFLPDFRGELLQGKVIAKNDKTNNVDNIRVGISFIGDNDLAKIASTDKDGNFYFYLQGRDYSEKVFAQVLKEDKENYKIILIENKPLNLDKLVFNDIVINENLAKLIDLRSKYMQIENAYNSKRQNSNINQNIDNTSFFEDDYTTYNLDDYARFKTIKATMVEILKNTWINRKGTNYTFHVKDNSDKLDYNTFPLILIDGYIVDNHNELIDLNPKLVKTISISKNIYQLNSKIYQGVISVKTFKKNYTPVKNNNIVKVDYKKPLTLKKYFSQTYNSDISLKRIPDYRLQLLWQPNIIDNQKDISFYTSDVTGDFEIDIQGFTNEGKPITIKEYFSVK
jgi:hypothetical protein